MSEEHTPAKMAAGALAVSMAFLAVGTEKDPNAPRLANRSDWERCYLHPIHPVEYAPGQTKVANFAHNWTDGARVAAIWICPVFIGMAGYGYVMFAIWALLIAGVLALKVRDAVRK